MQFASRWQRYQELVASEAHAYLFLAAATSSAMSRLETLEEISVKAEMVLGPETNVFSDENTSFRASEKEELLLYCRKADRKRPKGWGDCGLLLVISTKTPNNSIPILHTSSRKWNGIFPRSLSSAGRLAEVW